MYALETVEAFGQAYFVPVNDEPAPTMEKPTHEPVADVMISDARARQALSKGSNTRYLLRVLHKTENHVLLVDALIGKAARSQFRAARDCVARELCGYYLPARPGDSWFVMELADEF